MRNREKLIDIIGVLTDFFGTGKSNEDIGEVGEETKEWKNENRGILDSAEKRIARFEAMVEIPERKRKGTPKKKIVEDIVVDPLQTKKRENPEMPKDFEQFEQKERSDD